MPIDDTLGAQVRSWAAVAPTPAQQAALRPLIRWIREQEAADILFVCTHNSRRSHIAQLWAQAAAHALGVGQVTTWSGGTEATAFNPRAVRMMRAAGFRLEGSGEDVNVRYAVSYGDGLPRQVAFSKVYSDPANPQAGFAAVMVCDSADQGCPVVFGAALRVSLPFVDPKRSDGAPAEAQVYAESGQEIGQVMAWLMGQAAKG